MDRSGNKDCSLAPGPDLFYQGHSICRSQHGWHITKDILDEREKFSDIPIGKLYGKNMPKSLIEIHKENDEIIEKFIFGKILNKDNEKIEMLFNLYKKCIEIDTLI